MTQLIPMQSNKNNLIIKRCKSLLKRNLSARAHEKISKVLLLAESKRVQELNEKPIHFHLAHSGDGFTIWRPLTLQEKRFDWHELSAFHNIQQKDLKGELINSVRNDLRRNSGRVHSKLKSGDIAGLAAIALINANRLNGVINKYIKASYEKGKTVAARAMNVPVPSTPTIKTQLMNLDSAMIAEQMATDIDLAAKQKARDGFAKGVAVAAIISSVMSAASKKSASNISHVVGNVIGENLNKGSRLIYESTATRIQGFQRSEILDDRTCAICEALDKQIVTADDPFAQLDQVHDWCRGAWVPIIIGEEFNSDDAGVPARISDNFDLIGGAPSVNAFTQLKKPLDEQGQSIADDAEAGINEGG